VSGATEHAAVGEVPMGTPLRDAIEAIGGGVAPGRAVKAVLQGVASAIITADMLDTPLSWEGMEAAGTALGAGAFTVFDDTADMAAVAFAVSRFLAVESCGQCVPCKQDGLLIANAVDAVRLSDASQDHIVLMQDRLASVTDGARCSLATQHQVVVGSILRAFRSEFDAHIDKHTPAADPAPVLPVVDLRGGRVELDVEQNAKQPDWSHEDDWSGQTPADRLADHRAHESL
jgi:NADH:ubiquinone oxidoreductase subunit F (NADH-binding)